MSFYIRSASEREQTCPRQATSGITKKGDGNRKRTAVAIDDGEREHNVVFTECLHVNGSLPFPWRGRGVVA
jgi:hypothetical protein